MKGSVWYLFPGANEAAARACAARWNERGYRVACAVDVGAGWTCGDVTIEVDYRGYYAAVRELCALLGGAGLVVCGGDDILPDPVADPAVVAVEFFQRFPDGFGVMQPVGDLNERTGRPFGGTASAAVSPWIGRGWIERAYGGRGPHWCGYHHLHGDEELQQVATAAGVFWQRADLCQRHEHWTRPGCGDNLAPARRAEIVRRWDDDRALFLERMAAGWPGFSGGK